MADIEENIEVNEEKNDIIEDNEEKTYTKNIEKPKKPRTDKQKQALIKAQQKRKENAIRRKMEQEEKEKEKQINPSMNGFSELDNLSPEDLKYLKQMALGRNNNKKKKKQVIIREPEPESESSEEEVVYIKPKAKKKKKKKKVIVEASSSSESESEEEQPQIVEHHYTPSYGQQTTRPLKYSDVFRFS